MPDTARPIMRREAQVADALYALAEQIVAGTFDPRDAERELLALANKIVGRG